MLREPTSDRTLRPRAVRSNSAHICAALVDFENLYTTLAQTSRSGQNEDPMGDIDALDDAVEILSQLRIRLRERYGTEMAIGRSYADFDRMGGDAQTQLQLLAFEPRFMLGADQKSSADILLSIDAIEILLSRPELNTFIIVGGNRGYLPVVRRIREHLKRVILVGFEKSTSGDLRQVVGEDNFIALESFLVDPLATPEPTNGSVGVPSTSDETASELDLEELSRHDPDEPTSDEETLEVCMEELLGAYYQYGGRTVWLTPFLRLLNDRFPYLDNRGRKRLVEDLQARQAIQIEKVEGDPYPYSVVEINWESTWVQKMDEDRGNA